jgi:hypothetical protein
MNPTIVPSEVIQAINKEEINQQIATARQFPRDVEMALKKIIKYATRNQAVAESCYYSLKRKDKNGDDKYIVGESIRFAEIIAHCWGNLRAGSRVLGNDGKVVTAQGYVHDLESNLAVAVEAQRSIVGKYGIYPEYLIAQSGMASASVAFRNAIFKAVPLVLLSDVKDEIRKVILGSDITKTRKDAVEHFTKQGIKEKDILKAVGKTKMNEINEEDICVLRGIVTAIEDKEYSLEEAFGLTPSTSKKNSMSKVANSFGNNAGEDEPEVNPLGEKGGK